MVKVIMKKIREIVALSGNDEAKMEFINLMITLRNMGIEVEQI